MYSLLVLVGEADCWVYTLLYQQHQTLYHRDEEKAEVVTEMRVSKPLIYSKSVRYQLRLLSSHQSGELLATT